MSHHAVMSDTASASDTRYLLSEGSLPVWALPDAANVSGVAAVDSMNTPKLASGSVISACTTRPVR